MRYEGIVGLVQRILVAGRRRAKVVDVETQRFKYQISFGYGFLSVDIERTSDSPAGGSFLPHS